MTTEPKLVKPKRTSRKVSYKIFEETVAKLAQSEGAVCQALGYAVNSWFSWKKNNYLPTPASLGCEALQRRLNIKDKVYLIRVGTKDKQQALEALAKGLDLEFITF